MYSDVESIPAEPAEIAQLLDEHHLAVVGGRPGARAAAHTLTQRLAAIPRTDVLLLRGERVTDLTTFCGELERAMPGMPGDDDPEPGGEAEHRGAVPRTIDGVIDALRSLPGSAARHQYFLWQDADTLLEANVRLFGQLANAFIGVAAEREHVTPDVLVLQRVVFVGGDKLGAYAEEERGQFRSWLLEDGTTPFWEVLSCLERPPVLTYRLDG